MFLTFSCLSLRRNTNFAEAFTGPFKEVSMLDANQGEDISTKGVVHRVRPADKLGEHT